AEAEREGIPYKRAVRVNNLLFVSSDGIHFTAVGGDNTGAMEAQEPTRKSPSYCFLDYYLEGPQQAVYGTLVLHPDTERANLSISLSTTMSGWWDDYRDWEPTDDNPAESCARVGISGNGVANINLEVAVTFVQDNPTPTPTPTPTLVPNINICDPKLINEGRQLIHEAEKLLNSINNPGIESTASSGDSAEDFSTQGLSDFSLTALQRLQLELIGLSADIKLPRYIEEKTNFENQIVSDQNRIEELQNQIRDIVRGPGNNKYEQIEPLQTEINGLRTDIRDNQEEVRRRERSIQEQERIIELREQIREYQERVQTEPSDCPEPEPTPTPDPTPTPEPTPTAPPNEHEIPCPPNIQESIDSYNQKAAQAHRDYNIGAKKAVTIIDAGDKSGLVAHSGEKSKPGTILTPEEASRPRYFIDPPLAPNGIPYSYTDAERKAMEYLAHEYNGQNPSTNVVLYSDRPTFQHCQPIAGEFRQKYPNARLLWFDSAGKCY
ncbi:MAG: hypothetical protein ACAI44_30700, partial [Candidatus Sericytochromatia bacterium]